MNKIKENIEMDEKEGVLMSTEENTEINKEWRIEVGEQKNFESGSRSSSIDYNDDDDGSNRMSDEEYEKRYGHPRGRINFLSRGQ